MKTTHKFYFHDARAMDEVDSETVDLIVTSPPYPMIEMWDTVFSSLNGKIEDALQREEGSLAFTLMHQELNKVWNEVSRVLKPGAIACVNIGDATRKIGDHFQRYPNHAAITRWFREHNFSVLPAILWRKQTNAPNKFMGSGMLPPNAYVTLEHEYILIFRKGNAPRTFKPKAKRRYQSAYFWEERNKWFSDVWTDIKGAPQELIHTNLREKAAAFPFELPYRLINMYSVYGDVVLDPFWGTGTTSLAAMAGARNSLGYEINEKFMEIFQEDVKDIQKITNRINANRVRQHLTFIKDRKRKKEALKYHAKHYDFKVMTKQEKEILLRSITNCKQENNRFTVDHEKYEATIDEAPFQTKLGS